MLSSKLGELWRRLVQKREMVGIDESLNKYYIWQQQDYKGDWQERREVQLFSPPKEMADYDPNAVPTEWRSWLAGHRRVPPSPEEAERLRQYREMVRANAQKADQAAAAKEQRGTSTIAEGDTPNMGAFLRQLGGSVGDGKAASRDTEALKKEANAGEASGEGDNFKPGQWGGR